MSELIERLQTMRAGLVGQMAVSLEHEENWHTWLPLLAQVEAAIQAVEAVMEEGEGQT